MRKTLALAMLLAVALTAGCKDDEAPAAGGEGETTSGGEAAGGSGGEAAGGSGDAGGSSGAWDGDDPAAASGGEAAAAGGGGEAAAAANPFGETRAEQCRRQPPVAISASAQSLIQDGIRQARGGDVAGAQSTFQRALSADRNAYTASYDLGVLADRRGNENEALERYRDAIRVQGDYAPAAEGIVTIHFRRGAVPDAVAFIEPIARRFTTSLEIQALYAEVLVRANRFDDAWNAARAALRCDERFVPALVALVKASRAQQRRELARTVLDQALGIDDANAELHYLKALDLKSEPGRLRDAMTELRRAVELDPDLAEARMELGLQLLAGGNYQDALAEFTAASRLMPAEVAVHINLGNAYRSLGQWEQAKASFDRALQMNPNLPGVHFNLGLMYQSAGATFPGLDELGGLRKAQEEFTAYRNMMGPRIPRDDPSEGYLTDIQRSIERVERRIAREAAQRQRDAERAARAAAVGGQGGGTTDGGGGSP